jgi:hypothetical protein
MVRRIVDEVPVLVSELEVESTHERNRQAAANCEYRALVAVTFDAIRVREISHGDPIDPRFGVHERLNRGPYNRQAKSNSAAEQMVDPNAVAHKYEHEQVFW